MKMHVDSAQFISMARPTRFFNPPAADAFHLPAPSITPVRAGSFVGDTQQGGSVNCFVLSFCPHGSGTHTECIGHIVNERISVIDGFDGHLMPATLITVTPMKLSETDDTYDGSSEDSDWVIPLTALESLKTNDTIEAVVVRVRLPEGVGENGVFSGMNAPYFTAEAMAFLGGVLPDEGHLLTNLPSIDREQCGGVTPNHRSFWGLPAGVTTVTGAGFPNRMVTELLCDSFAAEDGEYILDLQVAPMDTDAVPSRPLLYSIKK